MTREGHQARLAKIEEMRKVIQKGGDEGQELRRLPDNVVDQLIEPSAVDAKGALMLEGRAGFDAQG